MFYKTSSAKITAFDDGSRRTAGKTRSLGSFEYEPRDGFLYVSVRACSADVPNLNDDMLPHDELKTAYRTFEGCPVFVNHKANDPDRARGYIIGAEYHDEDPSDRWIEILMEMDEVTFPKLCGYIRSGEIDTVSMGASVSSTECSICGNVAENASEFCGHVLSKGNSFDGKRAYEICHGIEFVEESWVYDPADPTATVQALEKEASIERDFGPENFYDSTESNWTEVEDRPSGQPDYISESGSEYWYYDDGVIRGSDHWGYGIGSCHWYLDNGSVQSDEERYGFSSWGSFSNTDNFDYVVDRKIERMLEGYDPGQGTLENHVFEDLRWNRTDLNMDVYEEAKRMIGVTASRRKQSAVGFVEMNPQDGTWYAACGTEEDPEKYWVTTKETKEDAIDALKNPQDWFEGEYERADEVYEVEDYFFGDEELEGDRVAESEDSFAGSPRVPEEPDMSDNDEVCPMCGSMAYDGEQCSVCGYQDYSEGFGNIEIDHDEEEEYEEDGWEDAFNEDKKKLAEFFL